MTIHDHFHPPTGKIRTPDLGNQLVARPARPSEALFNSVVLPKTMYVGNASILEKIS
jgi:hypothetical protein